MEARYNELGIDVVLSLATAIPLTAYMLGIMLDPLPAAVVGFGLASVGILVFSPREERVTAAVLGLSAVGIAGIVVLRAVTSLLNITGNELLITLVGSGLVLLLAFALVRKTVFPAQKSLGV